MFEYGDKMVCIDAAGANLTQDKIYEVSAKTMLGLVRVVDDTGEFGDYSPDRFMKKRNVKTEWGSYVSVGEAVAMPGTNGGFTMVCFDGKEIPEGTKVYIFKE